jgi:hypothetical protein
MKIKKNASVLMEFVNLDTGTVFDYNGLTCMKLYVNEPDDMTAVIIEPDEAGECINIGDNDLVIPYPDAELYTGGYK